MVMTAHPDAVQNFIQGDNGAPFDLLGAHQISETTFSIRTFRSEAQSLTVIAVEEGKGKRYPMTRTRDEGFFEVVIPGQASGFKYEFEAVRDEYTWRYADPYAFPTVLSDMDLYLFSEGRLLEAYDKLGAHIRTIDGVRGVHFAVWAPNAYKVSVIGSFNMWDSRPHCMTKRGNSGIWELFIPELTEGDVYRYEIRSITGYRADKSDPYGFAAELRPANASVIADLSGYEWQDREWMDSRVKTDILHSPMNIYEVHLGSWKRNADGDWLTYREMADQVVDYVKEMGYSHIELLPVIEHPFDGSWGYQVTGYFAVTSRFGKPKDFMYFVDRCHQAGIGVILDWVPAHFAKDNHALARFDGTSLYEHADPRQGEHPDWGTFVFNYGRNEVRAFLMSSALFWLKTYHLDGLRVDGVTSMLYLDFSRKHGEWLPNQYGGRENLDAVEFLKEFNIIVHREVPGAFTVAEESTSWPMVSRPIYLGGLGFTFKWNMGWMHDVIDYIGVDPVYRRFNHNKMTFSMAYAFNENFVLSLSHDEVVHGKGSMINKAVGDWWQQFATMRLILGYQFAHPGKKLNFMGQEFGQWREWSEARGLDWNLLSYPTHVGLQEWAKALNHAYHAEPSMWQIDDDWKGFRWIDPNDVEQSVFSFIRFATDPNDHIVVLANFTPVPRPGYRIGVPSLTYYREVLNSDASVYGGGNIGNYGGVQAVDQPTHGFPYTLTVTIPPLGIVWLKADLVVSGGGDTGKE